MCSVKKEHNININSGIDCQYFLFIVSLLNVIHSYIHVIYLLMVKSDWRFDSSAGQVVKTKPNQCHLTTEIKTVPL